jgi:threonine-phosphate decarboxylase
MLRGHGGNGRQLAKQLGCLPEEIIDMSSNINPLGPPPGLIQYLREHIEAVGVFPEVDSRQITGQFADHCRINCDRILAGNGTTQFIYSLPQALGIKKALIAGPTYADYADACHLSQVRTTFVMAEESRNFQPDLDQIRRHLPGVDSAIICNPNNPTGTLIPPDDLEALCRSNPAKIFIIDESYLPFIPGGDQASLRRPGLPNLIVLSSISKIYAIPGLRIGFVIAAAEVIERLKAFLQPWSVNSMAQIAVAYLLENKDGLTAFVENTQHYILAEKRRFFEAAGQFSTIRLFPSATHFFLAGLPEGLAAPEVLRGLAEDKFLIRSCHNFKGLSSRFVRIALKTPAANRQLAEKLRQMSLKTARGSRPPEQKIGAGA